MSRQVEGAKFATAYTKRPRFRAPEGSRMRNDYEIQIDKKGHKSLKCVGEHDIYEEIQSYAEECKIENILARAAAGDVNALNQRQGFYADISEMPKNLAEAQNSILKLSKGFEALPAEIREKFDNSKEKFVQEFGSNEWAEKMGFNSGTGDAAEKIEYVPGTEQAAKEILTPEENK